MQFFLNSWPPWLREAAAYKEKLRDVLLKLEQSNRHAELLNWNTELGLLRKQERVFISVNISSMISTNMERCQWS